MKLVLLAVLSQSALVAASADGADSDFTYLVKWLALFAFIAGAMATFMNNAGGSDKSKKTVPASQNPYAVPKQGGALQNMPKDDEGNISLPLTKKIQVTDDTYIFRFSFDKEESVFGLPIGKHVVFTAMMKEHGEAEESEVERKYTPISQVTQRGYIDFLIKIYRKNVHPRFPDGGLMTQYMESMNIGDILKMEGPKGRLEYQGNGNFVIAKKPITGKTKLGFIAGGTGITPCYQVIQSVLVNNDTPNCSLVFGNRTTNDILLKEELMQMADSHPDKFNLFCTVDVKPEDKENWRQGVGFITKEMLAEKMPAPSEQTLIAFCGPPMFENLMKKHLSELGYTENMIFKF